MRRTKKGEFIKKTLNMYFELREKGTDKIVCNPQQSYAKCLRERWRLEREDPYLSGKLNIVEVKKEDK